MKLNLNMNEETKNKFNGLYKELKEIESIIHNETWPNINDGWDFAERDRIRKELLDIIYERKDQGMLINEEDYVIEKIETELEHAWGEQDIYYLRNINNSKSTINMKINIFSRHGIPKRLTIERL